MANVRKTIGIVFSVVGTGIFIGGGFRLKSAVSFVSRAQFVPGVISREIPDRCEREVGSKNNKRKESYTCYQPVVKYSFANTEYEYPMSERSSNHYQATHQELFMSTPKNPKS